MGTGRDRRQDGSPETILRWIVRRCDRTYRTRNWAGNGVLPAIRDVAPEVAHWRTGAAQHTIAEIVAHMAYWKDFAAVALRGERPAYSEALNWPEVEPSAEGWHKAQAELARAHRRLMAALQALTPSRLADRVYRDVTVLDLAVDIATHDSYHVGQIYVLKRAYHARQPTPS